MNRGPAAAALVVVALATVACSESARVARSVAVGQPLPAYRTVNLAGDSVSIAQEKGRVVLLNLWATWCHPCRDEIPVLQALHERYASQGLRVIGVSVDANGEEPAIRDFMKAFRMTYPVWRDPNERISQLYLAIGVPTTFLVSREGVLLWRHTGPVRRDDRVLVQLIERALADTVASAG